MNHFRKRLPEQSSVSLYPNEVEQICMALERATRVISGGYGGEAKARRIYREVTQEDIAAALDILQAAQEHTQARDSQENKSEAGRG
jgi:hypothetical protein